ncbi:MAG: PHP domain-containing protein [Sulfurovum sp.]
MKYNGTRWHKCDFHLHTTASDCFEDKNVTAKQWVDRAIEQGLNCVAITDHNTGGGIDAIQEVARDTNLTIFPAVEITCDTSKVHLLILFDIDKTSTDVEDFLISCDIERDDFGKQDTFTSKSILEISEIANNKSCLIIPAHIDEYNGLGDISYAILQQFFKLEYINAVQIVHKEFLDTTLVIQGNTEFKNVIDTYYDNNIDYTTIKEWQKPVKLAIENKKALLTFSDNPDNANSSQHGLWGIGNNYSWIKMEEKPTLESLRQAFLLPELRVKNSYESMHTPYTLPNLWIKSISIDKTEITDNTSPFQVNFNPQLTTVIGGRGSGKSSILRFLRGAFSKTIDSTLTTIKEDQTSFYQNKDRNGKGVLTDESIIETIFIRNEIEYKINVLNKQTQETIISKFNRENGAWEIISEDRFIEFFEFEHYSQKHIYEIAQKPNSLRERIDDAIEQMDDLKSQRDILDSEYLAKSAQIRTIEEKISEKGKITTELKDITTQIELYERSNIAQLLKERSKFIENEKAIKEFHDNLELKENSLNKFIQEFDIPQLNIEKFDEEYNQNIVNIHTPISSLYDSVKEELLDLERKIKQSRETFISEIRNSNWNIDFKEHSDKFEVEKERLKSEGLSDIANFEKLTQDKGIKEKALATILQKETELSSEILLKTNLHKDYILKLEEISKARKEFLNRTLTDQNVKINIKNFRNKDDFESSIRTIIQREDRFYEDIDTLKDICFNGFVKTKMNDFRSVIIKLKNDETVDGINGHFKNVIKGLTDAQVDKLMLLMPEDEIEVQYKPNTNSNFKSLSTASAGQKTTAILTFILSFGNSPLILDQPEDDLDNRLVYDLVVERLKVAKENRQIIIVTHNANIPVNGDAEYIISMDSESKYLKILTDGSVDKVGIKKEICDVMEGSEAAFDMRSRRYKQI